MTRKESYGAEEARARLPEILKRAHDGKSIIVTKYGRPYAAIVPVRDAHCGRSSVLALRGTGRGLWEDCASVFVTGLREEWR